jgi:hypothetical protein
MNAEIEAMFEVPEGHTPKVLIGGGTNHKNFAKVWDSMVEEKVYKDMDNNSSRLGLPLHPVLVLLIQGDDGHIHALISLPLQKWDAPMRIESTIDASNDLRRVMDWCAGFMEVFCMNDSISAVDLTTNTVVLGDPKASYGIEGVMSEIRPKKDVRGTAGLDIGSVDDILGQLSKPQIEKFQKKVKKEPATEKVTRIPVKEEVKEEVRMKAQQQEVLEKYGKKALQELCKSMKMPLLIDL